MTERHALSVVTAELEDPGGPWVAFYVTEPGDEATLEKAIEILRIRTAVLERGGGPEGPVMAAAIRICGDYLVNATLPLGRLEIRGKPERVIRGKG